jgi:putative effector of murein hydrolase LrgA (UPF0299 family)
MIEAIASLLLCQLAGETLARGLSLPVPGPVIGLALLFLALQARSRFRPEGKPVAELPIGIVAGFLLAHLSLLFVPAGAGIVRHAGAILQHGWGLAAALMLSTALTLVVTATVFVAVAKRMDRAGEAPEVKGDAP